MAERLSEAQLEAILSQQIELARNHDRTERSGSRDKALDYYLGNMDKYVPPEPNRSKVVSRDVADVIGWTLPQITRVFAASDKMAIANPTSLEDEEFAKQATNGLNHVFWKDNDGEEVLYDSIWDALLVGNSPIKTYYDPTPVYATSFHSGLTEDQLALLLGDDTVEVLAQTKRQEPMTDPASGQQVTATLYDVKIRHKKLDGTFCVEAIPPEEFLIDGDATRTEDAAFTDHWQRKTRSALVEMGYDKATVWTIPESSPISTPEAASRDPAVSNSESTDMSMQLVDYHECFIRIDVDGDGEAELVRACYAGRQNGKLLDWEVWEDEHPFDDIKCEPIPHRWLARSQADETMDIQDIKTVLSRQVLNNIYWVNNPQRHVDGKVENPDQLDNPTFGGTVYSKNGVSINPLEIPYIGDKALAILGYIDEMRQQRTGVGRQSMALDPDVLQGQTAAAVHDQHDASYSQVEQYARNMAAGWRKVFRKLLKLMIKHQDYARQIMVNGQPAVIDPRYWNADMDVTINVGLGTGSRDRDLAMLGQVLNSQILLADRFISSGAVNDAIDLLPKIILTMTKMAESAGIRNPEDFYPEYTMDKVNALKQLAASKQGEAPIQLQVQNAKSQADAQIAQIKAQADQVVQQSEAQLNMARTQAENQRSQADAQVKAMQAQSDARAAELQAQLAMAQLQVKQLEIAAKSQTDMRKAELAAETQLQVAEIGAGNDAMAQVLEANLGAASGFLDHAQQMQRAEQAHQHALDLQASAPQPQPNGAA